MVATIKRKILKFFAFFQRSFNLLDKYAIDQSNVFFLSMGYHWCWKLERECLRTKEPTNEPKEWWRIVEMHIKYMCSKIMVCSLLIALKRFLQIRPNFQHINPNAVIYAFFSLLFRRSHVLWDFLYLSSVFRNVSSFGTFFSLWFFFCLPHMPTKMKHDIHEKWMHSHWKKWNYE